MHDMTALVAALSDFDPRVRRAALEQLSRLEAKGSERPEVNLHYHTFFSFNAEGWSPSRIAREAYRYGLEIAGVVDFDVLDAMDEFLEAGDLLGLRTVAGIESRVFIHEYAGHVLNSPNEPGVAYYMGVGCFAHPAPGSDAEAALQRMRETARARTVGMMRRLNAHLPAIALDEERDVLVLTPKGNATERHLLAAYDNRARVVFPDARERVQFWSGVLGTTEEEIAALEPNTAAFHERIRAKLMKFGGVGYVRPDSGSFPTVEEMITMVREIGALPAYAWLDGSHSGETDIDALLDLLVGKGTAAMNIIPDRNWNFKDPQVKAEKTRQLYRAVEAASARDLPIVVGTEMNRAGLPFVDDFTAPELLPVAETFRTGARVIYGHTMLARLAGLGYWSVPIEAEFGTDRKARNAFFAAAGACSPPSPAVREVLRSQAGRIEPQRALSLLQGCR